MEVDTVVDSKEGLFSTDYVTFRLDLLEQKVQLLRLFAMFYLVYFARLNYVPHITLRYALFQMALIEDVDQMIDLERDRVETDVRDIQMQRALLCLLR